MERRKRKGRKLANVGSSPSISPALQSASDKYIGHAIQSETGTGLAHHLFVKIHAERMKKPWIELRAHWKLTEGRIPLSAPGAVRERPSARGVLYLVELVRAVLLHANLAGFESFRRHGRPPNAAIVQLHHIAEKLVSDSGQRSASSRRRTYMLVARLFRTAVKHAREASPEIPHPPKADSIYQEMKRCHRRRWRIVIATDPLYSAAVHKQIQANIAAAVKRAGISPGK